MFSFSNSNIYISLKIILMMQCRLLMRFIIRTAENGRKNTPELHRKAQCGWGSQLKYKPIRCSWPITRNKRKALSNGMATVFSFDFTAVHSLLQNDSVASLQRGNIDDSNNNCFKNAFSNWHILCTYMGNN